MYIMVVRILESPQTLCFNNKSGLKSILKYLSGYHQKTILDDRYDIRSRTIAPFSGLIP